MLVVCVQIEVGGGRPDGGLLLRTHRERVGPLGVEGDAKANLIDCCLDLVEGRFEPLALGPPDSGRYECRVDVVVGELAPVLADRWLIEEDLDAIKVRVGRAKLLPDPSSRVGLCRLTYLD